MKKLLAFLLILTVLSALCACNLITPPDSGNGDKNPPTGDPPIGEDPPLDNDPETPASVVSISLSDAKTSFAFGESFSTGNISVIATLSDGSNINLNSEDYTVTCEEFNSMKTGEYRASVTVNGTEVTGSYNVTVTPADRLKVLMIGNSYADDTINYAYEIARSMGIPEENILIADIYIGGCSIATHWQNALNNEPAYRFGLEKEGWFDGNSYTGWTMEQAISYTDWDFITLQQNSGNSGIASTYKHLQSLMSYVLDVATDSTVNPNANPNVKLVWHQTWAYQKDSGNSGFAAYGRNQQTMYDAIISATRSEILTKDFAAIIPNGTAIQNGRTSFIGDSFSRDDYDHLDYGAGRYIAALNMVATLTGRDPASVSWRPLDSGFEFQLSDKVISACKESVINAIASPLEVTPSKFPADDTPTEEVVELEGKGTAEDPYLIQSAEDMLYLSRLTAGRSYGDGNMYFKLTADIDLGSESWQPICSSAALGWVEKAYSFNANLDGNGKTVTFTGNYTGDTWAKGLFSAVGGHIHDLTLRGEINSETGRIGSLASMAMSGARIENIVSYVNITAKNNQIGGIIGYIAEADVILTGCENHGNITGRELVGGIVGGSWQNVVYTNCKNLGIVTATKINVGGIVGEIFPSAQMTGCSNEGKVIGSDIEADEDYGSAPNYAGNLVGVKR